MTTKNINGLIVLTGDRYYAIWNCTAQKYTVYRKTDNTVVITNKYRFRDIETYLI